MVPNSLLTPLLSLVGTVFSGFVLGGLWIWRQTRNTDTDDIDRLKELENDKRGQLSAEIADLYSDIEAYIEEKDDVPPEMGKDELVVNVIHNKITEEQIKPVTTQLGEVGEIRETYEQHEQCFRDSFKHCAFGAAFLGILAILVVILVVYTPNPFGGFQTGVYAVLAFMSIRHAAGAYNDFMTANNLKDEFEESWRDYKMSDRYAEDSPNGDWFGEAEE